MTTEKRKKIIQIILIFGITGVFLFGNADIAWASDLSDRMMNAFGWIVYQLVYAIGMLFLFLLDFLIQVASWNKFVSSEVVSVGWKIVRDICNMFFIFILLLIAFGTVLQRDDYNVKKLLPKLLIMAILINFSKTICGLFIDFSQVVMLSFVSAISNGGNNLADLLGIEAMYTAGSNPDISALGTTAGLIIALLISVVCVIVLVAFIFMLVSRVIMLWVSIILSPMAYLLAAFPEGKKYSSQWWSEFTKNVIVGPVLAFFLWLTLATAQQTNKVLIENSSNSSLADQGSLVSGFLNNESFTKAIITLGLLMAGLKIASSIGASAGGALGKAMGRINKGQSMLTNAARKSGRFAGNVGMGVGAFAGKKVYSAASGVDSVLGGYISSRFQNNSLAQSLKGGVIRSGVNRVKDLATARWIRTRNADKTEADKARHDFARKWEENEGNEAERDKLRLKYRDNEYRYDRQNNNFYRVNKDGNAVGVHGKELGANEARVLATRRDFNMGIGPVGVGRSRDSQLTMMSSPGADFFMGRFQVEGKAWGAARQAVHKKISESQKEFEAAGFTPSMMMQVVESGAMSSAQKMAAALTMAIKDGFKGMSVQQVATARQSVESNQLLLKEFNDNVNKKFAHLNNDLTTDAGKASFKSAYDSGKFEILHEDAYKDPNVLSVMGEHLGAEFGDYVKKVSKKSDKYKNKIIEGLGALADREPIIDGSKDLSTARKNLLEITGNIGKLIKNSDFEANKLEDVKEGLIKWFKEASTKKLAKLSEESFVFSKTGLDAMNKTDYEVMIREVLRNTIDRQRFENLSKNQDASRELVKLIGGNIQL